MTKETKKAVWRRPLETSTGHEDTGGQGSDDHYSSTATKPKWAGGKHSSSLLLEAKGTYRAAYCYSIGRNKGNEKDAQSHSPHPAHSGAGVPVGQKNNPPVR